MLQQRKLSRSRVVALAAAIAAVVPLWSLGCGGSPGGPTSVASKPLTSTLAGTLVDTISGGPVGGATVTITGRPAATTNADGQWESTGAPLIGIAQNVTAESEGFLTHQTALAWSGADRRDVTLDAIPDRAPFSLEFYRQIVRDGYERPMVLQPLRRWTTAPSFYINVTNASTNETMDASEVAMIVQAIRDSVPQMTGGRFEAGPIDTGTEVRTLANSIYVHVVSDATANYCGRAFVGVNPGDITLNYGLTGCGCGRQQKMAPSVVAHEVGHALGFWHVDGVAMMNTGWTLPCASTRFTDQERVHAAVAYARPLGNRDIDIDPSNFTAATAAGPPPVVICRR